MVPGSTEEGVELWLSLDVRLARDTLPVLRDTIGYCLGIRRARLGCDSAPWTETIDLGVESPISGAQRVRSVYQNWRDRPSQRIRRLVSALAVILRDGEIVTIDGYCTLGEDREYNMTDTLLLEAMDVAAVDKAIIAPPDRNLAVYNREGNDSMLRAARNHPSRFIPACSVNPWYDLLAAAELQRAVGEGARILVLHPFVQGFSASDELIFPLLDQAATLKIPVYIHTGMPGNSTPWQIADLAEHYPEVDIIMGHSGATDFWNDVTAATLAEPNVYLESSLARPFIFVRYLQAVGSGRGIVGSWAPINNLAFEWEQMRRHVPPEVFAIASGANLAVLLRKRCPL